MALDHATKAMLEQLASAGGPALHEGTPEEARALGKAFAAMAGPAPRMARADDEQVAVSDGSIPVQVLIYPVTDADFDRPSYHDPENQLILTRDAMVWFWDHYVPDAARRGEPDASPLRAPDLSGLPPAVVLTAEHDVLRDEGEA